MDYFFVLNRRITYEMRRLKSNKLSEHYNLMNNVQIVFEPLKRRAMNVNLSYHKPKTNIEILDLPEDINRYIRTFLSDQEIILRFQLCFYNSYPFDPIEWSLKSYSFIGFSKQEKQNILTFVKYKLKVHNDRNIDICLPRPFDRNWSPVITVEKDILCFYTKIYDLFEIINKRNEINNV